MYWIASPTVVIFSASSSGISMSNSSSNAITSSTVSRESAPRSSMNFAAGITSFSSTPSCSTMIALTRSSTGLSLAAISVLTSSHVQPTVDVDHLACDVTRPFRGQEPDDFRHFLRGPNALQRNLTDVRVSHLGGQRRGHVCLDESWRDGVDQNTP